MGGLQNKYLIKPEDYQYGDIGFIYRQEERLR